MPAEIGVAFAVDNGEVRGWNLSTCYPLMSVFKIPVSVTALHKLYLNGGSPSDTIRVESNRLHENTWSPMRDRYRHKDFSISFYELLNYTISMSDNNACDILIDYCGGIDSVADIAEILSDGDIRLKFSENDMHKDIMRCYSNCATPDAIVRMLRNIYRGYLISGKYLAVFSENMLATSTGNDKLKASIEIGSGMLLGHKTGSSDRLGSGAKIGDNDVGVIYLPDGRRCYIAVMIKDSMMSDKENAAAISMIADCILKHIHSSGY